jgi:HD superfamily phosphodiesterase
VILCNEKQLTPGAEGMNGLELANALLLSGKTGREVSIPVSRKEIKSLYKKLVAKSKSRKIGETKRVTDPAHAPK